MSNLSDIGSKALQVLKTFAPQIGMAIGGPLGGLAGAAIQKVFGTPAGDTAAAEAAILNATPDQLLALRKENDDFIVQMKKLGIDEEQLQFADLANARAREIAVKDTTPRNLAYMLLGGTLLLISATFFGFSHIESVTAGTLIGYLISENKAALQYYFGSSIGSDKKTDALADIAKSP